MKNITKRFPGVLANDKINFQVTKQEIHCLVGENGTGKTTLMNILFGIYDADAGEIFINGSPSRVKSPKDAYRNGIGMVHQHFMLVNQMTVLENIILGKEAGRFFVDNKENANIVEALVKDYGFKLDINQKVSDLSVGMKQRVEILKTLYRGADIIILDEPTAVLTPQEVEELFKILSQLKSSGKTIVFITHKLNETMEIADSVTVLRKGRNIVTVRKTETNAEELARYMVGRDVNLNLYREPREPGRIMLSLKEVTLLDKAGKAVDLDVREGEILGIAGVDGNGQLELEEAIMGIRQLKSGRIFFDGADITRLPTKERKELGIAYIPSDRHKRAMLPNFTVKENYLLGYHTNEPFVKKGIIQEEALKKHSLNMIESYEIKVSDCEDSIGNLSGGNQQKVILSREISQDPKLIIAAQPARGLDIGAIEYVHKTLLKLRSEGKAILLISAELSEIMSLSDRIAVLYEGEVRSITESGALDRFEIGLLMAGQH
ncbi:MAG TPA: ABC transporter ATP-binding protein [Clostridia bacterium]|nr:ABC transporter ATP-binding protein [Clostridia bacterium]